MQSGSRSFLKVVKESTWGNAASGFRQIRFSSESLEAVVNRAQEPVMTGNIGASRYDIMGIRAEGSISTLARPDDIGFFLFMALGAEDSTTTDKSHTFTPAAGNIPSFSIIIGNLDTPNNGITFPGCKINTLSFSAAPEDYLAVELGIVAKTKNTTSGGITPLAPSTQKAFKFKQGKVYISKPSWTEGERTEIGKITSISLEYNNNLEAGIQTTSSEGNYEEPVPNTLQCTVNLEFLKDVYMIDGTGTNDIPYIDLEQKDYEYSLDIEFTSDEGSPAYSLKFALPTMQVTSFSAPVSDANALKVSVGLEAFDNGADAIITVTLLNNETGQYGYYAS